MPFSTVRNIHRNLLDLVELSFPHQIGPFGKLAGACLPDLHFPLLGMRS